VINNLIFEISERFWWSRKFDVFWDKNYTLRKTHA
jgi:hypothetical protein